MYVSGPKVMVVSMVFIVRQTRVVAHSFCYFSEMPFFFFDLLRYTSESMPSTVDNKKHMVLKCTCNPSFGRSRM